MDRGEILRGLLSAIDRKIKSLMIQSDLGIRTYEDICAVDEERSRQVEESLIELAAYIARLERDRQALAEMLRREETRY
jgi:hypothetical protein